MEVFRYGHRKERDKRITTHVALVARAFGANKIYIHRPDESIKKVVDDITARWGGNFEVELVDNWRKKLLELKNKGKIIVHLTMYGEKFLDRLNDIKKEDLNKIVVFVGAEKVPAEVYEIADYNIAIGNQPHSEVAALAIFLDRVLNAAWNDLSFENAKMIIEPQKKGKKVIKFE